MEFDGAEAGGAAEDGEAVPGVAQKGALVVRAKKGSRRARASAWGYWVARADSSWRTRFL